MQKVKYRVTGPFGDSPDGEIRWAWKLIDGIDNNCAILYHPKDAKTNCASIEMASEADDGMYEAVSDNAYINIDSQTQLDGFRAQVNLLKYKKIEKNLVIESPDD